MSDHREDISNLASTSSAIERQAVSNGFGTIRLYSADGQRSTIATVTLETTAKEIADNYNVDALYLQTGNLHIRALDSSVQPLRIVNDLLLSIGYNSFDLPSYGRTSSLRSIFALFLGRPQLEARSGIRSEILMAECDLRRGRLVHKWTRNKCILYNGCIRIQKESSEDELLPLARVRIDIHDSKRGRGLMIIDSSGYSHLFMFEDQETLLLWLNRCQQNLQSTSCDLSDRRLTLLPESLFLQAEHVVTLNLRRNSLSCKSNVNCEVVGWLDELSRFHSLVNLDLSYNRLVSFPLPVLQITQLRKLNLSSNRITVIPNSINLMRSLIELDLSNNWLSDLPTQIIECSKLKSINLNFNRFYQIPHVLPRLDLISSWKLAGNEISNLDKVECERIQKIDLRRNSLGPTFRLSVGSYEHLTHVDIRDNESLQSVYLTNVPGLKVMNCSRLQLTALHLNGSNLTHIIADHNLLDNIVVMPIPLKLEVLDVSHNHFSALPDWISDLPSLSAIRANHNNICKLPQRLFALPALRLLSLHDNIVTALPDLYEDCFVETLLLQNNHIAQLPHDLWCRSPRLRHLNVCWNSLSSLPVPNKNLDANRIQVFRAASNQLDEISLPHLIQMKRLKILDLSYNRLHYFDDSALSSLIQLEELNLSGNCLSHLSSSLFLLPALSILRAHSNQITNMPDLSQSITLQIVDLSNNQISHFDTSFSICPTLKSIDVTCNPLLPAVYSGTLRTRRKRMAVLDVGVNCTDIHVGFAETTGSKTRLCIRRVQHGSTFAMVDGGSNYDMPKLLANIIEKEIDNQKQLDHILLSAHLQLEELGERIGSCASVVRLNAHSNLLQVSTCGNVGIGVIAGSQLARIPADQESVSSEYSSIRNAGHTVDENNLINGVCSTARQLGLYYLHPAVAPKPTYKEYPLESIEFIILASHGLWDHLTSSQISEVLINNLNPLMAAKKLQDCLQSCDYAANSSIVVIRVPKPHIQFSSPSNSVILQQIKPKLRSNSIDRVTVIDETTLEEIENRIEKIAAAVSEIERDGGATGSGRVLYDRILAEEIAPSSHSPSIAPPDPQSRELNWDESNVKQTNRYTLEGYYSLTEQTRKHGIKNYNITDSSIHLTGSPDSNRSETTELRNKVSQIKEPDDIQTAPPLPTSGLPSVGMTIDSRVTTRFRFEDAKSSIHENLRIEKTPKE